MQDKGKQCLQIFLQSIKKALISIRKKVPQSNRRKTIDNTAIRNEKEMKVLIAVCPEIFLIHLFPIKA